MPKHCSIFSSHDAIDGPRASITSPIAETEIGERLTGHRRGRLAEGADARTWSDRLLLANQTADLVVSHGFEPLLVERRRAGQQLVEQDAQRVDVAAGVHVEPGHLRPFRTHVEGRADQRPVTFIGRSLLYSTLLEFPKKPSRNCAGALKITLCPEQSNGRPGPRVRTQPKGLEGLQRLRHTPRGTRIIRVNWPALKPSPRGRPCGDRAPASRKA